MIRQILANIMQNVKREVGGERDAEEEEPVIHKTV